MDKLNKYRKDIDSIDSKLVKLLLLRLRLAKAIGIYKKSNKLKIKDKKRESGILSNIEKYSGKAHQKFFKKIFGSIISYSKKIQRRSR